MSTSYAVALKNRLRSARSVAHVGRKLRALGEREVSSRQIGELVMEELHGLDEVAYVRFASVYRQFQDVEAFREEIEQLGRRRARNPRSDQLSLLPADSDLATPKPRKRK